MALTLRAKTYPLPQRWVRDLKVGVNRWTVTAGAVAAAIGVPLLVILVNVFGEASDTWHHVASTLLPRYVENTLRLVLGTGGLTLVLGVATAWLVTNHRFPGHRLFEWALMLPLAIPTYIAAFTYAGMLDYTGPVQSVLRNVFGVTQPLLFDIMTLPGVIFVMAFVLYPYVYILTRASFMQQSSSLFEAAQILGKSRLQTFFQVGLPLARPAIIGGVFLVVMEALNDYGAVHYFGVDTFTTGIFRAWFSLGDADAAIRLCAFLMVLVFLLLGAERCQRGRAKYDNHAGRFRPLPQMSLTGWRGLAATVICLVPLLFGFLLPVAQLLLWAWGSAARVLTPHFFTMLLNSFLLAGVAALLTIAVALLIVYAVRLHGSHLMRFLSKFTVLGYTIPGAVIAVGVMLPFAWVDSKLTAVLSNTVGLSPGLILSGTVIAVTFAYVVRFLALAVNPIESGFEKSCHHLDEASRSLGVAPLKTLLKIDLPLIKGSLLGAAILVFVDVLKELPLTLILRPFNFDTLATKAFELASDELVAQSANPALIIIAAGILPMLWINRLIVRGKWWKS